MQTHELIMLPSKKLYIIKYLPSYRLESEMFYIIANVLTCKKFFSLKMY